jgi:hypothetical protein
MARACRERSSLVVVKAARCRLRLPWGRAVSCILPPGLACLCVRGAINTCQTSVPFDINFVLLLVRVHAPRCAAPFTPNQSRYTSLHQRPPHHCRLSLAHLYNGPLISWLLTLSHPRNSAPSISSHPSLIKHRLLASVSRYPITDSIQASSIHFLVQATTETLWQAAQFEVRIRSLLQQASAFPFSRSGPKRLQDAYSSFGLTVYSACYRGMVYSILFAQLLMRFVQRVNDQADTRSASVDSDAQLATNLSC